jgi:glycosyltransferase involved in cell wall biosynthesis
MKLCIVNLNFYRLFNPESTAPMGGAELDMYLLATGLASLQDSSGQVIAVTGDWGQQAEEEREGVGLIRGPKLGEGPLLGIFRLWKSLIRANADIYLSSGAGAEVGIIALYCQLYKRRAIYRTAHEIDCNGAYIRSAGIAGRLYRYGLERASAVVVTVASHTELLRRHHPELKVRPLHIPLGIQNALEQHGKKRGVLWVARCDDWKRPEYFLELARALPHHPFTMICPAHPAKPELFAKMQAAAEIIPNLTFIPFVPFHQIQTYFDRARVFVNTSDYEGFTYTLIQAGLANTPVAYLNVNPDGVITAHALGVWAEGDREKLAYEVEHLLTDQKKWHAASTAIRRYVEQHHVIANLLPRWQQLFQGLALPLPIDNE